MSVGHGEYSGICMQLDFFNPLKVLGVDLVCFGLANSHPELLRYLFACVFLVT